MVSLERKCGCLAGPQVCQTVRGELGRVQAMRMEELERRVGLNRGVIERALQDLIDAREVEVLRPRFNTGRAEFFRLIRETDNDFLWEQEMVVRAPATRMTDITEFERPEPVRRVVERRVNPVLA